MKKQYRAILDNGHEFSDILYTSEHRSNSKANIEDCKKELRLKRGKSAKYWKIIDTYRDDSL